DNDSGGCAPPIAPPTAPSPWFPTGPCSAARPCRESGVCRASNPPVTSLGLPKAAASAGSTGGRREFDSFMAPRAHRILTRPDDTPNPECRLSPHPGEVSVAHRAARSAMSSGLVVRKCRPDTSSRTADTTPGGQRPVTVAVPADFDADGALGVERFELGRARASEEGLSECCCPAAPGTSNCARITSERGCGVPPVLSCWI